MEEPKNMEKANEEKPEVEVVDYQEDEQTLQKYIQVRMYKLLGTLQSRQDQLNKILYELQKSEHQIISVEWLNDYDVSVTIDYTLEEDGKDRV